MRRLLDLLLTTDPVQRTRLVQAAMAGAGAGRGGLALLLQVAAGAVPARPAGAGGAGTGQPGAAVRGRAQRLVAPLGRPHADDGADVCRQPWGPPRPMRCRARRGAACFLVLMVVLMAAMPTATPQQMRGARRCRGAGAGPGDGSGVPAGSRAGPGWRPVHFAGGHDAAGGVAADPAAGGMRARSRRQQQDLEAALVRIRELATRDELTGLVNRRHMRDLMEQEHQRCIRSGRTFCLAVLDIDQLQAPQRQHGRSIGDAVLRSVAHEAMRRVRVSDAFCTLGRRPLRAAAVRHPRHAGPGRRRTRAQRHRQHAPGGAGGRAAHHAVGRHGRAPRRRNGGADAGPRRACAGRGQGSRGATAWWPAPDSLCLPRLCSRPKDRRR
jgi:hypothetical protein